MIAAYSNTFDLRGFTLRFANIIGPREKEWIIVDFIKRLRGNPHSLEVIGDGRQKKS